MDKIDRIRYMRDKWSRLFKLMDDQKLSRKEILQRSLDQIKWTSLDLSKIQLEVNQLQGEQLKKINYEDKFRKLNDYIVTEVEKLTVSNEQLEIKVIQATDERMYKASTDFDRNIYEYNNDLNNKLAVFNQFVEDLKDKIEIEKNDRAQSQIQLNQFLEQQVNDFKTQLEVESEVRKETNNKIMEMINNVHSQLQQLMDEERKERQITTENLFQMMSDACIKLDKI